jgi:protein-disulfide isomerase-like protein with CxxC motif
VPEPVVKATYFTDPFCPWCWATEPALRRLQSEYDVEVTFVIAGLVREVDDAFARHEVEATLDAAAASGQPADARVWLHDPPRSSYPAGIAFHAVADQGDPAPFLRRVRESVYLERRRMDGAGSLLEAIREVGGPQVDLSSDAHLERFGADLERARDIPEEHCSPKGRAPLPTLQIGEVWVAGDWEWEKWKAGAEKAGAQPLAGGLPDVAEAVRRFGSITTAEVATVTGLPAPRAAAELWSLALEHRVTARRVPGGELWSPAA